MKVSILDSGGVSIPAKEVFGPEAIDSGYFSRQEVEGDLVFPTQTVLVTGGGLRVLVDPGDFERMTAPGVFDAPKEYAPPPPVLEQLSGLGVAAADVTHVVITHLHYDHYSGTTRTAGGELEPAFPNAKYMIPKLDWEMPAVAVPMSRGEREVADTLTVLMKAGVVQLVQGGVKIAAGLELTPTPGETPGHQALAVKSMGESLYCVGDLFHMKVEIEHPEIMATWADREETLKSRRQMIAAALREEATIVPTHMHHGRITSSGGRTRWSS